MAILDFSTGKALSPEEVRARLTRHSYPESARRSRTTENRKAMLAKVHIGKKRLGLDDETYRALLSDTYGVNTAAKLSVKQLDDLLMRFQAMGAELNQGVNPRGLKTRTERGSYLRKIEALLAEKGSEEGRHISWDYAAGILERQTKGTVKSLDAASIAQLRKVIAALTYDARRKGRFAGTWGEKRG